MAHIIITTFGSTGDLNPFIAIGTALQGRGHDITFAVEDNFAPPLRQLGFDVAHLSGDQAHALAPYQRQIFDDAQPLASLKLLIDHYIVPTLPTQVTELRALCRGADLLVAVASQFAAPMAAELAGIPWASVILTPSTLPSAALAAQPQPVALPPALQRLSNRLSWFVGGQVLRRIVDAPINRIRASFGLAPRRDLLWTGNLSPHLSVMAVSSALVPRPIDWLPAVEMLGFCFWDGAAQWTMPDDLRSFLEGDRPIVAVTAGTVAPAARDIFLAYYHASLAGILANGARALVINAAPLAMAPEGRDVYLLDAAPFSAIFPHCAAVIHHGGIGTVAQCLRAGVPSLVVPGGVDQPFNAAQVAQRGVGLWLPRNRCTSARVAHALRRLLTEPGFSERARMAQTQVAREDAPASFCGAIEPLLPARTAQV
jgi:rhamnosyltransferase subunit B